MRKYVVGYLFTLDKERVVLIRKAKGRTHQGLLVGIGGHVEEGESFLEGMQREGAEEAGVHPTWEYFMTTQGYNSKGEYYMLEFFRAFDDEALLAHTTAPTEGEIVLAPIKDLCWANMVDNSLATILLATVDSAFTFAGST